MHSAPYFPLPLCLLLQLAGWLVDWQVPQLVPTSDQITSDSCECSLLSLEPIHRNPHHTKKYHKHGRRKPQLSLETPQHQSTAVSEGGYGEEVVKVEPTVIFDGLAFKVALRPIRLVRSRFDVDIRPVTRPISSLACLRISEILG